VAVYYRTFTAKREPDGLLRMHFKRTDLSDNLDLKRSASYARLAEKETGLPAAFDCLVTRKLKSI
jgi:hypothetical protein